LLTALTVGVGLTVIVNKNGVPIHPFANGITVIVAITGAVPALVAVKDGIFPVPFAASPMDGALLTHTKVEPDTGPVMGITDVVAPLQ
jgi:hypothetical protein